MDGNTVTRWIIMLGLGALFYFVILPKMTGKHDAPSNVPAETYVNAPDFVGGDTFDFPPPATPPVEGELCDVQGDRFVAQLSTRGASLVHLRLTDSQYTGDDGQPLDMSTTPDHERWRSLRTLFRSEGANDQVKYDRFNWKLAKGADGRSCTFTYADDTVSIKKTVTADGRPFELKVDTEITNLSDAPKHHQLSISAFAFRQNKETKGKLGRVSPWATDLQCARAGDITRKGKDDFKEGTFAEPLVDRWAAVTNYFFAQALVPSAGYGAPGVVDEKPACSLLAYSVVVNKGDDADSDEAGHVYHAELSYAPKELAPKQSVTYEQTAFFGPKERETLKSAAGGGPRLGDLINLGTFSPVAKLIVLALVWFHDNVAFGNWGLAIIALTLCLRIAVFPLSWKQIQTTIGMRKLKPEIDQIAKKFPDDAQARQMATMELYRKNNISVLGGCLPQLVQLPIWWAMYTSLQTAVEMYHEKFLWLRDLAAPDHLYILPIVYGGFIVLQQRIVPQQGMDPMQQKMMTYMFPILFTVLVLFLPAALGVYMLTSSALGIAQQLVVEKIAPRNPPGGKAKGEILVRQVDDADGKGAAFGKGKARV